MPARSSTTRISTADPGTAGRGSRDGSGVAGAVYLVSEGALWKAKADRLVEAGSYHCPEDGLTRRTAEKLYGEGFPDSITRMEQFSSCAYAHFMSYGLGLKERQEYELKRWIWGISVTAPWSFTPGKWNRPERDGFYSKGGAGTIYP